MLVLKLPQMLVLKLPQMLVLGFKLPRRQRCSWLLKEATRTSRTVIRSVCRRRWYLDQEILALHALLEVS